MNSCYQVTPKIDVVMRLLTRLLNSASTPQTQQKVTRQGQLHGTQGSVAALCPSLSVCILWTVYLSVHLEIDYATSYLYAPQGQKEKCASPLCFMKNQPFQYIRQNKMCCDVLFSFWTCLCNKSAVLLGYRTQLSNELHTIFHYSFLPDS